MLGTVRMLVHLKNTKTTLKFILCATLAAAAILEADFCDQHVKAIRTKQKLIELDSGGCIRTVRKPKGRTRDCPPLPDGLAYSKG